MHPDITRLINLVKDGEEITEKQKEIILNKAAKLGEDVDEIAIILETIRSKSEPPQKIKSRGGKIKCPNCGAIISETSLKCPECDYTLQTEDSASADAKLMIQRLEENLRLASETVSPTAALLRPTALAEKQASIVNTFVMPTTKEGLIQFLEFSYTNYISIGNGVTDSTAKPLKNAWYGKTIQAYNTLARLGDNDPNIKQLLINYAPLIKRERKKIGGMTKFWIGWSIVVLGLIGAVRLGINSDNSAHERVEQLLEQGDYQAARAAAKYQSDRDLVSYSEVLYLISIGDLKKAKTVAAIIEDDAKRDAMERAIYEAEYSE